MNNDKNNKIIGYTSGVYDLFHIGHLALLKRCKGLCDKLIVGVSTDELLFDYKKKKVVIPFHERCAIVEGIKYVDVVVPQKDMNKIEACEKLKFNIMFVGDDWYNTEKWQMYEKKLKELKVEIIYFPYTKGTSSTLINEILIKQRKGIN